MPHGVQHCWEMAQEHLMATALPTATTDIHVDYYYRCYNYYNNYYNYNWCRVRNTKSNIAGT